MPNLNFSKANVIRGVGLLLAYSVLVHFSTHLANPANIFPSFWPPAGAGLFILLFLGTRYWPIIFLGDWLGNAYLLMSWQHSWGSMIVPSLGSATAETAEALLIVFLLRRFKLNTLETLQNPRRLLMSILMLTPPACASAAILGVASSFWLGKVFWNPVWLNVIVWTLADILGIALVAPFLYTWLIAPPLREKKWLPTVIEAPLISLLCLSTSFLAFSGALTFPTPVYFLLASSLLILVFWATLSFSLRGTASTLLFIATVAVIGTSRHHGPFGESHVETGTLELQIFLAVISVLAHSHSLVLASNLRMRRKLEHTKDLIEEELQNRTHFLLKEIEDKKIAQAEIKRENQFSQSILETIGSLVMVLDPDGSIIRFNRACEKTSGFTLSEAIGKKPWDLLVMPEHADQMKMEFLRLRSQQLPLQSESPWKTKTGEIRWIAWESACITNDDLTTSLIIVAGMDISDRKEIETRRNVLLRETQLALKQREEFLYLAAHELRTPLTPLKLLFDLLRKTLLQNDKKSIEPGKLARLFTIADSQIETIIGLVNSLLELTRARLDGIPLERKSIELSEIVNSAISRSRRPSESDDLELQIALAPGLTGNWDSKRLEKVVANLFSNALKFGMGRPISIKTYRNRDSAVFVIEDQGIGLSIEDQAKIFEEFSRATESKQYGGFGLGLYVARRIIEAHQGKIWVESKPGEGSKFIFEIPLDKPAERTKTLELH